MNLKQLQDLERQKAQSRTDSVCGELPGIRASGLIRTMSDEERKAWFEKIRKESGVQNE